MDLFLKKYGKFFKALQLFDEKKISVNEILYQANIYRVEACESFNIKKYDESSYLYFMSSCFFFKKYQEKNDLYFLGEACIYKYEQLKGKFSAIYIKKSESTDEILNILNILIDFLGKVLVNFKDKEFFKENYKRYYSIWYSDKILRAQLKSNINFENKKFSDAKSEMKFCIELTEEHINYIKKDILNEIFDVVHLRVEEANLKMRQCEYKEMVGISLFSKDLILALDNFLKALKYINEALEISPEIKQIKIKKEELLDKIRIVLSDEENLDKWKLFYEKFKEDKDFLILMSEIDLERLKKLREQDSKGGINIFNNGNFSNNGIIGDSNKIKTH